MIDSGYFCPDQPDLFRSITDDMKHNDYYLLLADFQDYVEAQARVEKTFLDSDKWTEMSILNCANMGVFSSDRTIKEYNQDIWKSNPVPIKLGTLNR